MTPSRAHAGRFTRRWWLLLAGVIAYASLGCLLPVGRGLAEDSGQGDAAKMLIEYYEEMSAPKPFFVRKGQEFAEHQRELREKVLASTGLWPLPERVPLDVHQSEPLDHPWCTIRQVYYQLWPGVYSAGLMYMPKELPERPAPAMLCPHGHWQHGNAHPEVQRRCLNLARLGYVTFASTQNHYEDLYVGVSHQTLMIWTNMRALDYLETLPEVDKTRIGVAGASGGGLQTQMLAALDTRVKAATIVGLTCDFRRIMFPDRHHCVCNHFPGVMQFTDHPEISALTLPTPVEYLTMNDWTKEFCQESYPTIQDLYAANGLPDRVDCKYYDTPHSYDRPKRERTYWWMDKWLRGVEAAEPASEPDAVETFPVETLTGLKVEVPANKGFGEIGRIYRNERGYQTPTLSNPDQWRQYRERMLTDLNRLLGEGAVLPRRRAEPETLFTNVEDGLVVERVGYPSEGGILVPTIVVRKEAAEGRLPVIVMCDEAGKEKLLERQGPDSPTQLAREGALVALPDVRCYGELLSTGGSDDALQRRAWERNGIVWGRPVPGMGATDLRAVLDGLASRPDVDTADIMLVSRNSGGLAIAVLFAAALDTRVASAEVDLAGCCFEKRNLPLVSCVLQHGDVLQWAALAADRKLTIRNVPREAGDPAWLADVFGLMGSHADVIAVADHAMDVHGEGGRRVHGELKGPYGVPYRCLVPKGSVNLLVACRGASFSHIAASSCRLSRTMVQLGHAAGLAAAMAVKADLAVTEIDVAALQSQLGLNLPRP